MQKISLETSATLKKRESYTLVNRKMKSKKRKQDKSL